MENKTSYSNITKSIESKLGKNLHNKFNHPIKIIKDKIYQYFDQLSTSFEKFDNLSPFVSTVDNFDKLLIPYNHPARAKTDTYYVNETTVLRTHTSAHQNELLATGHTSFLVTGDVYRRDEIDRSHYPVFTQMEGLCIVPDDIDPKENLLQVLVGLVEYLCPGCEHRVSDDYFPFTDPSYEIEVLYQGSWLEILGCGVIQPKILENNRITKKGWAFGLGLDRLCMTFFNIPDIRYIWSECPRFLEQFKDGQITKFKPYSELPSQYNDISFWIPINKIHDEKWMNENDFYEVIRETGEDWVEKVQLMDKFFHPKKQMHSRMYRITYSPKSEMNDPGEFTRTINRIQENIREHVEKTLDVQLR
jgi:phenylalanyl-tRNA synthetase alpha chain